MFNPYSTRPVGSSQFEDHILDIMTSNYYRQKIGCEDYVEKTSISGSYIWKSEPDYDPFEQLAMAVTAQAIMDYISAYRYWTRAKQNNNCKDEVLFHSRMLQIENDFFRRYDVTESVFNKLLKMLEDEHILGNVARHRATYLIDKIANNYSNYCKKHGTLKVGGKKND